MNAVRDRRYKWLGHILRLEGPRLVKLAVRAQYELDLPGNICMDAPPTQDFDELTSFAADRKKWAAYWQATHLSQGQKRRQHERTAADSNLPPSNTDNNSHTTPLKRIRRNPDQSLEQAAAWQAIFSKAKTQNKINNNTTNTTTPTTPTKTTNTPTTSTSAMATMTTTPPTNTFTLSPAAPTFTPTTKAKSKCDRKKKRRKCKRRKRTKKSAPKRVKPAEEDAKQKQQRTDEQRKRWAQAHWYQNHGYKLMASAVFSSSDSDLSDDVTTATLRDALKAEANFIPAAHDPRKLLPETTIPRQAITPPKTPQQVTASPPPPRETHAHVRQA